MRLLATWIPIGLSISLLAVGLAAPSFYATWIDGEFGFVEIVQLLPPAAAIVLVALILRDPRAAHEPGLRAWLIVIALACVYLIGEEASWGQHYFGWGTPDWIAEVNRQQETNLHNTSSWLNEKPRSLFELGVIAGGIVHPLLLFWRGRGLIQRPWWLAPTVACLPSALLAELWRLPERLFETRWVAELAPGGMAQEVLQFVRYSEVQELYFFYFILIYVVSIRRRLRTKPNPAGAA